MEGYKPSPEEIKNAEEQMTPEQKELSMDRMRETNAVIDSSMPEVEQQLIATKEMIEHGFHVWGPQPEDLEELIQKMKMVREENLKYLEENK